MVPMRMLRCYGTHAYVVVEDYGTHAYVVWLLSNHFSDEGITILKRSLGHNSHRL